MGRMKRKPDLLFLVVLWGLLSAFLYYGGMILLIVFILPEALGIGVAAGNANPASMIAMIVGGLYLLISGTSALVGAIGILKGKRFGRLLCIIAAVMSMVYFPIGTIPGVLVLLYLSKAEVVAYFEDETT